MKDLFIITILLLFGFYFLIKLIYNVFKMYKTIKEEDIL